MTLEGQMLPLGVDALKNSYWYFGGHNLYTKLPSEEESQSDISVPTNEDDSHLKVSCKTFQQWERLLRKLKRSRDEEEKQLATALQRLLPMVQKTFETPNNPDVGTSTRVEAEPQQPAKRKRKAKPKATGDRDDLRKPAPKKLKKARPTKKKQLEPIDELISIDHEVASLDDHKVAILQSGKKTLLKRRLSEKENDGGSCVTKRWDKDNLFDNIALSDDDNDFESSRRDSSVLILDITVDGKCEEVWVDMPLASTENTETKTPVKKRLVCADISPVNQLPKTQLKSPFVRKQPAEEPPKPSSKIQTSASWKESAVAEGTAPELSSGTYTRPAAGTYTQGNGIGCNLGAMQSLMFHGGFHRCQPRHQFPFGQAARLVGETAFRQPALRPPFPMARPPVPPVPLFRPHSVVQPHPPACPRAIPRGNSRVYVPRGNSRVYVPRGNPPGYVPRGNPRVYIQDAPHVRHLCPPRWQPPPRFDQKTNLSQLQDIHSKISRHPDVGNLKLRKLIVFVDLDNWSCFFARLSCALPIGVFVWGFYGGYTKWNPPLWSKPFMQLIDQNGFYLHPRCGTRKDAADFALCMQAGVMHAGLPSCIPFLILSGDKGFEELQHQLQQGQRSREAYFMNPHQVDANSFHQLVNRLVSRH